jgi:site-specific DNA recombinase
VLYRGDVVWNRKRKRDAWGVKRYLDRPESEWLQIEAPALRIVAEDLWQAAQKRLEGARGLCGRWAPVGWCR